MIQIAPSILSANFTCLADEIHRVTRGGAHSIHIDVMDGHFVPNITIGPLVVQSIKSVCEIPLDVHLMIENPDSYIKQFIHAGADRISVHVEACCHLHRLISNIRSAGVKAGVAINPATPLGSLSEVLPLLDYVLIMTVNPGFGGQVFIEESLDKIRRLANVIHTRELNTIISVDGGITLRNAPEVVKAGARVIVAGNAIFHSDDPETAVRQFITATDLGNISV